MDLLYTTNTEGAGVVFAARSAAESVARLHAALRTAPTWRALKEALLPDEWNEILDNLDQDDADIDPDEPLDADEVPGYADGLYPLWLQTVTTAWIPDAVIAQYGTVLDTPSGTPVEFQAGHSEAIADELRALGHTVTKSALFFF